MAIKIATAYFFCRYWQADTKIHILMLMSRLQKSQKDLEKEENGRIKTLRFQNLLERLVLVIGHKYRPSEQNSYVLQQLKFGKVANWFKAEMIVFSTNDVGIMPHHHVKDDWRNLIQFPPKKKKQLMNNR